MFCKEKINAGRQLELDLARGLAVLFMIFIHSQLLFANESVSDSLFGQFNDFVGMVPSAPMFMFLLGVGINFTKKNEPKLFLKRGLMLILAGYLLNFLKGFVPCIINAYRYVDISYMYEAIAELMYVDILHFSGLAMIMFGFFKYIKANIITIGLFGIVFSILNIFILNISVDNFGLASITGLIWGTSEYSYFPFLTWSFYPIAGFIFGSFLIRCEDKKKFYALCLIISAIVFFGGTYIFNVYMEISNGMISDNGYYHHILTDNITFTALVILEISLLSFITKFTPKFLGKIIARWSKNVTPIFFIHWIILTWTTLFIANNSLSMLSFIILLVVVISLSDYLANLYSMYKKKDKNSENSSKLKQSKHFIPLSILLSIIISIIGLISIYSLEIVNTSDGVKIIQSVQEYDMEDYIYTGVIDSVSKVPYGFGSAYYTNGDIYEGEFKNGYRHGQGKFIGSNGEIYIGEFFDDEYSGNGDFTDVDGSKYVGEFKNDDFNGYGTFTDIDGNIESGVWEDGILKSSDNIETEDDEGEYDGSY